jgi:hypothetical protein
MEIFYIIISTLSEKLRPLSHAVRRCKLFSMISSVYVVSLILPTLVGLMQEQEILM